MSGGTDRLDVDALLSDGAVRTVVCCGSGGVGKTTTAAALGLRAAALGRQAVVITVDPARRLAQSMGLSELDNTPRPVELPGSFAAPGGSLHAMMLDMKRTFDEIVEAHAAPERAREILANPFYRSLSSSFTGTQEYMAMEKLGQLREDGDWDLIIVDTPPSRSALDFLDAPERLGRFLDGRLIRVLGAPARTGAFRLLGAGVGMLTGMLSKIVGAQALKDVQSFVASFDAVFGGFQERAERTYRRLQDPGTAFLVVAVPESDAVREAAYFVERLAADSMPLAGMVMNRTHRTPVDGLSAEQAMAACTELERQGGHPLAAAALRLHARAAGLRDREAELRGRLSAAHPGVPVAEVPARTRDVHDLAALREVGDALGGGPLTV
ncbi:MULTISPECIES: ArsA family ATPase [Nocardiopsis]|uniref:ArsA family ATPase n=1 Tax=Nocardiopsis TaxID=2013 RepID=UPI0003471AD4|nr:MULTISPECIES: ArsA-related P-loop ATPase [Nocardiopsis]